jgi:hypothetical protein
MTSLAISEITRRNLFDELRLRKTSWAGRLGEAEFLGRVFDLAALPSYDHRQKTMAGDIGMHREHFVDWEDDWVFKDQRLNLLRCADETLLGFLCQMIHPIVRSDEQEVAELVEMFNRQLQLDGYELTPQTYVSGKPIYAARPRFTLVAQVATARRLADELSSDHIADLITRMEMAIEGDPALAIGSAKEFVESICKGILAARQRLPRGTETLPQLVKATRETLNLSVSAQTGETLRQTLSGLASVTQGIAELRGQLGSGHGHLPDAARPTSSVARLSVNTAVALGVFLYETHRDALTGAAVVRRDEAQG